ncbi:hypothetical protein SDC9_141265 [bioreactor metagenome]|uniref:Uncharacterized protein n=1 Tax=bioreactor metagenome TaxID=1076179 RepID=A0A645E0K4_9ZZZZ
MRTRFGNRPDHPGPINGFQAMQFFAQSLRAIDGQWNLVHVSLAKKQTAGALKWATRRWYE